jgi:hypothetical protein
VAVVRVADPQAVAAVGARDRPAPLLEGVDELLVAGAAVVAAVADHDMVARGEGERVHLGGGPPRPGVLVQPYVPEVGADAGLGLAALGLRDGGAGRGEHPVDGGPLGVQPLVARGRAGHGGVPCGALEVEQGGRGAARQGEVRGYGGRGRAVGPGRGAAVPGLPAR